MEGMVEAGEYPKRKISAFMYAATVFSSLGSFLFGFHTGGISSAIPLIKYRIGIDHVWQESIVSITIGAAAVSSLVGGTISDCFGRKFTMRCSSMFFLLGSIVFIAANEKITLLVSRTLLGFATGFACASVPLYIAECSPTHSRGVLLSLNSVFITGGNFISNFLCAAFSSYVDNGWRLIQTLRSRHGTHGQARDVIWRCTVEKAEPTPVQTAAMFSKCLFRRSRGGGRSVKGSVQTISQAYLAALNVVKPLIAGPPYETMQKFTLTDVCMDGTFVNEDLSGKIAWCTVLSFT